MEAVANELIIGLVDPARQLLKNISQVTLGVMRDIDPHILPIRRALHPGRVLDADI